MDLKSVIFIVVFFVILACESKDESDDCSINPGCPPPTSHNFFIKFQLLNSNNEIIDLTDSDEAKISLTIPNEGISAPIILDSESDQFFTDLAGIVVSNLQGVPNSRTYMLDTDFGEQSTIDFKIENEWADKCQWCRNYFIGTVIQDNVDTVFHGTLQNSDILSFTVK